MAKLLSVVGSCSQQVPRSYVLVTQDGWWRRREKVALKEIRTTGTTLGISVGLENVGIERDDLVTGPGLETVKWGLRFWCCCRAPALLLCTALKRFFFGEEMLISFGDNSQVCRSKFVLAIRKFLACCRKVFTETSCNKDQFNVN